MAGYPRIILTEEGMRDGLQIESAAISVHDKIRLLDALSETGLKEIAVGSFVSPKWTPQMAEVDELVRGFHPRLGVRYTYTALNDRGVERAREFTPPLSAPTRLHGTSVHMCDVFVQRNANRTQAQEIARWPERVARAREQGATQGGIGLGAAWGSNWTGEFSLEQRMHMLHRQYQLWDEAGIPVTRVDLADPMSWNMPHHVERQIEAIKVQWPSITDFNLHLHNGRGMALPSTYAALRVLAGTDTLRLQSAIGGMAGCPYCGNGRAAQMMATEDLIHMLEDMGINTGVDLYKLIEVVWLAEEVVGHPLYGFVSRCGPRPRYDRLYAMDMPRIETLEEARHFIHGAQAYEGAPSPWKAPITSWQRPEAPEPPVNGHISQALGAIAGGSE
ncbi:MAG TPA: citramalate synthase [Chloroflexota bacterium]|nr:citramalate synthase [Chloroflexota bacterium]